MAIVKIKRELNKFFPAIGFRLVYALKAGGIAIHLNTLADFNKIKNFCWPKEAFGNSGQSLHCHVIEDLPKLIVKNVDPNYSEEQVENIIGTFIGHR